MLQHVERGTQFTNDFGDIDEPFYIALETMLGYAVDPLFESPNAEALYEQFHNRFKKLESAASGIGWGYGDSVSEVVGDYAPVRLHLTRAVVFGAHFIFSITCKLPTA